MFLMFLSAQAFARPVDEIKVKATAEGYEITLYFNYSIEYRQITPQGKSKTFYLQLKTNNFQFLTPQDIDSIQQNAPLSWDQSKGIPLQDISFESNDAERPRIIMTFKDPVEVQAHSNGDLRSLVINIKSAPLNEIPIEENILPSTGNANGPDFIQEMKDALLKGENDKAVQFCIKALQLAKEPVKEHLQELLGVAYERNNQLTHAIAEYQIYLDNYPKSEGAERVRQRLAGAITAAQQPMGSLKEPVKENLEVRPLAGPFRAAPVIEGKPRWIFDHYGNISEFYNWDNLNTKGSPSQFVRHDITTDLDFNAHMKKDDAESNLRMSGEYMNNRISGASDVRRVDSLSLDYRSMSTGLYGRVGRQTLQNGGVLGRFDGVYVSKQINPFVKINGLFGFPVDSDTVTEIKPEKKIYGVNADWGNFFNKWNFNSYFIDQTNDGYTDRRAIGTQGQYADQYKAFFTMVDWDIYYNKLDIAYLNGHWILPTKTTLSFSADYRKSPVLLTNNAIQGLGVTRLTDLSNTYTSKEIKQLALDRTTNNKSFTAGIAQDITRNLQWNFDFNVSQQEGTITSGGVQGSKQTRPDFSYDTQLVKSGIFKEEDSAMLGFGYAAENSSANNDYSLNFDFRYPVVRNFYIIPKFHTDLRESQTTKDFRWAIRPVIDLQYNFTRTFRFDLEIGVEEIRQTSNGLWLNSDEEFFSAGFRWTF